MNIVAGIFNSKHMLVCRGDDLCHGSVVGRPDYTLKRYIVNAIYKHNYKKLKKYSDPKHVTYLLARRV